MPGEGTHEVVVEAVEDVPVGRGPHGGAGAVHLPEPLRPGAHGRRHHRPVRRDRQGPEGEEERVDSDVRGADGPPLFFRPPSRSWLLARQDTGVPRRSTTRSGAPPRRCGHSPGDADDDEAPGRDGLQRARLTAAPRRSTPGRPRSSARSAATRRTGWRRRETTGAPRSRPGRPAARSPRRSRGPRAGPRPGRR